MALAALALPARLAADGLTDQLSLRGESGGRTIVRCRIVDFDGQFVRFRLSEDGPVDSRPADQVVKIETPQTPPHIEGLNHYAQGQYEQAAARFELALAQESRAWIRRDILAMLGRCALRRGDYADAGARFLMIAESEPDTRHIGLVPLLWTDDEPAPQHRSAAVDWLSKADALPKLLGASALLFDAEHATTAEIALRRLAADADDNVQSLARAQLWRRDVRGGEPDDLTLERWEAAIRLTPEPLRGGPWFVLGEARFKRLQYDQAAQAYLWVPLVYDENSPLAATATLRAADSLRRIGHTADAATLYREVQSRHAETAYAQTAAAALAELKPKP
jgi:tetratricopeptide (TPR) repeat protein